MTSTAHFIEAPILQRLIDPRRCGWTPQAAEAVLQIRFAEEDEQRASELADRANRGVITPDEEREMEGYLRLGSLMDLMQSKARLYLRDVKAA